MKKLLSLVLVLPLLFVGVAIANGQDTCPKGDGWNKVEGLSETTYTYNVPEGYEVTENCYKASNTVVFGSGATVTSTVTNPKGKCCQELSHASFKLVKVETPEEEPKEPETPVVPETPVTSRVESAHTEVIQGK